MIPSHQLNRADIFPRYFRLFFNKDPDTAMPHSSDHHTLSIPERLRNLARKREEILTLEPEKAMDEILEHPEARALVHSFSEPDLYLMIQQIGLEDSHPLLELASTKQWQFMLDMECWKKDRLDDAALSRWMNHLMIADPRRTVNCLVQEESGLIERYLFRNVELFVREHDQELSDIPEDAVTLDGLYYFRTRSPAPLAPIPDNSPENLREPDPEPFLSEFLNRLAREDHVLFQNILWNSRGVVEAEIEEELYRLRNVRMAEKGFLPFEEAVGVYQPIRPDKLPLRPPPARSDDPLSKFGPLPRYAEKIFFSENHLLQATDLLPDDPLREEIILEITSLTNRIAVADQKQISSRSDLEAIAGKIRGYLEIGIEALTGNPPSPAAVIRLFRKHFLTDLFRIGYRKALQLTWRAKKWVPGSWFQKIPLPLSFWTESTVGVLGGLLLKRPLCYDNRLISGSYYREFQSMEDIRLVSRVLEETIRLDQLLSRIFSQFSVGAFHRIQKTGLTWQNLLLTRWACVETGQEFENRLSLDLPALRRFLDTVWGKSQPRIPDAAKSRFLEWLSGASELPASEIAQSVGNSLDQLFKDLESELGAVSLTDLDPRFIRHFRIQDIDVPP